jgi:hypothetical protein
VRTDTSDHADGAHLHAQFPSDRARVLLEINNAVVSHLDLARVLQSVSECLRRELNHDFAALAIYDEEHHELRLHALDFAANEGFFKAGQLIPLVGTPASLAFSVLRHRPDPTERCFPSRENQCHDAFMTCMCHCALAPVFADVDCRTVLCGWKCLDCDRHQSPISAKSAPSFVPVSFQSRTGVRFFENTVHLGTPPSSKELEPRRLLAEGLGR